MTRPFDIQRNVDHPCLRVEPFDGVALAAYLVRLGIAPAGPADIHSGAGGDGLSLYFQDSDVNAIELKGAAAGAGGAACNA